MMHLGPGAQQRLAVVLADVFDEPLPVARDVVRVPRRYLRRVPFQAALGLRAVIWAITWLPLLVRGRTADRGPSVAPTRAPLHRAAGRPRSSISSARASTCSRPSPSWAGARSPRCARAWAWDRWRRSARDDRRGRLRRHRQRRGRRDGRARCWPRRAATSLVLEEGPAVRDEDRGLGSTRRSCACSATPARRWPWAGASSPSSGPVRRRHHRRQRRHRVASARRTRTIACFAGHRRASDELPFAALRRAHGSHRARSVRGRRAAIASSAATARS